MNTYYFDEIKGRDWGNRVVITAESFEEACKKFGGIDEVTDPYKKFKRHYFDGMYTVRVNDSILESYAVHTRRKL